MADDYLKSPILLINSYLVSGLPPGMFFTKIRGSLYTEIDIFIRNRGSENAEITEKDRGFDNFACQIPRSSQFFVPLNGKFYIVWVE